RENVTMKTIELSNDRARIIGALLARKWANAAVRICAVSVAVNTPYRFQGEATDSRPFKARIARVKREMAAYAAALESLGATLPTVNHDDVVGPYKSPTSGK